MDDIAYLHDHLRARQAVTRDAGRSWLRDRSPQNLERLEDASESALTAWHWYNRALLEAKMGARCAT